MAGTCCRTILRSTPSPSISSDRVLRISDVRTAPPTALTSTVLSGRARAAVDTLPPLEQFRRDFGHSLSSPALHESVANPLEPGDHLLALRVPHLKERQQLVAQSLGCRRVLHQL